MKTDFYRKSLMDMLARYKKPGGFQQILNLLESFPPAKRGKFMEMIEAENPRWARAIRQKILSMDRLLTWPEAVVWEIFKMLPTRQFACALKGIDSSHSTKILAMFSHAERRRIEDEVGSMNAAPDEIFSTFAKIIESARFLIKDAKIRLDKIDPELMIPENFEESLSAQAEPSMSEKKSSADVVSLQKAVSTLAKENKDLKDEVRQLRERLEQIRRIA